ncbi:family 78 glycoside hydrolase catalytic domain [Streptomyces fulvoviolaceus]|uniref:family 78 glycoside hydrolase catalytic domain n=1 Tax=Streptomyces fulvoviolaceus TaxID=285535 RepID=UPI000694582B|nr:family 78 glycoside hydrolase catalytic domain [Streptomyces fulvoviolaceus]
MLRAPVDLRTNARKTPLSIDDRRPEFAWRPSSESAAQAAYQVQVSADEGFEVGQLVWDSGQVALAEPFGVRYDGMPLVACRRYRWRVRIRAEGEAEPGAWSEPSWFETGVLDPARLRARWVSGPAPAEKADYRVLYLRGTVDLPAEVVRGRAYVSALGWYRFFVNGCDLTGPALVPRWTPFDEYVEYQTYDVTEAFRTGDNVLGLAVGDGRFRGAGGLTGRRAVYGDRTAGFVQVELDLADGSNVTFVTDGSWQAGTGRILTADPKLGERVDLRVPDDDWLTGAAVPARFRHAEVLDERRTLIAEEVAPVREIERLPARSVTRAPSGRQIVDFGQNFAGVVRIRLSGPSGTTVRLTHSEVLREDGELDTDYIHALPVKRWYQRDEVILDGEEGWWSPWFTIHGFRYAEVDGLPGDLDTGDVEGVVLSSDLPDTGTFDCSDERLVRLHRNVSWSLRSNFTDTPTDCPTRERSGWTGDIQVFGPTATTFVDAQAYLRRYLRNVAAEQLPDGKVPVFIPAEASRFSGGMGRPLRLVSGSVGWGDVTVLLPWTLYRYYGDRAVLEQQYSSMTAWVDQLARRARVKRRVTRRLGGNGRSDVDPYVLDTGFHFGEWLRPGENFVGSILDSMRHSPVTATAYFEHSARTLSAVAAVLGRDADAARYRELADRTRSAWRAVFLHADGRVGTDRQEDYVRALAFDLLEPEERSAAVDRLVALIEEADDHLATGFLSTPLLLPVLVDGGRADVAWRVLLRTTSPSWLYQVERGATTVWETWDGHNDKGEAKESHNHYALGSVARFLTEYIAGLSPAEPGYRVIDVRPLVGGGLTRARASVQTPYGTASSSWAVKDGQVTLEVTVPAGATARVHTGTGEPEEFGVGTHTVVWPCVDMKLDRDPSRPATTAGGGLVPMGKSLADNPFVRLGGHFFKLLPRLPRPVRDRVLAAGQRGVLPPKKLAATVNVTTGEPGGVPTTWLARQSRAHGTVVYLHGGSYNVGPLATQWRWLGEIQQRTGVAAATVLYRMAPDHPHPTPLNDAVAAITALHEAGDLSDGRWVLAGDSAGGGLALATAQALCAAGGPMPAGMMLTAPWVDLEMANPELNESEATDTLLSRYYLGWAARLHAGGSPLDDPALSPINGTFDGLPPVHLDAGTRDLFLPDVRRLRDALEAAGVSVTWIEQEGGMHTYPLQTTTREAQWTIRSQAEWLTKLIGG